MSERYSRLFSLPSQLYADGAPVIIEAGTLLKDNQTGRIVAQLKLTNIDDRIIKAVKVRIAPMDTVGRSLGDAITFDYLDLAAKRDDSFGQKNAIRMPDSATRSYQVAVTEVIFDDNSIWSGEHAGWEALPGNKNLLKELSDSELVKQYQIKYGAKTDFYPFRTHDLWRCACGVINHERESTCHRCGRSFIDFLSCDLESLTADKDTRLLEEKAAKEKKQAEAAAALAKQKAAKKKRAIASVAALLIIACVAGYYLTVNLIMPPVKYKKAVTMMNNGDYDGAVAAFQALNGFKDSSQKAADCLQVMQLLSLSPDSVGSTIRFGYYEQDNDTSNGEEEIEWIVLANNGGRALLISKYALDCQLYDLSYTGVTWETCALRKWLNETFLNAAFTEDRQTIISNVTVNADENPSYDTSPGNSTTDQLFLLSIKEADKYFSSDSARNCQATAYCKAQSPYYSPYDDCSWLLRSPGRYPYCAAVVSYDGSIDLYGVNVYNPGCTIRPAMWIELP